jgi:hypothetical protein
VSLAGAERLTLNPLAADQLCDELVPLSTSLWNALVPRVSLVPEKFPAATKVPASLKAIGLLLFCTPRKVTLPRDSLGRRRAKTQLETTDGIHAATTIRGITTPFLPGRQIHRRAHDRSANAHRNATGLSWIHRQSRLEYVEQNIGRTNGVWRQGRCSAVAGFRSRDIAQEMQRLVAI